MTERAPRYTSYPTAPHFHEGIGARHYEEWLGALDAKDTLSLYMHIPYCTQLCWFCGCHSRVANSYDRVEKYLALLGREIALLAERLPASSSAAHIHFGGGSPTIVSAKDFTALMDTIRTHFRVSGSAEIAMEIDPRTTDAEKIAAYACSGITRVSLGVQDFTEKVQAAVNRIQPYAMVEKTVRMLRKQGVDSLNIDLIYGLAYQTLASTRRTIEQTLTLEPNRISLFGYAHVPWMKKHQRLIPEEALPESSLRLEMFAIASEMLVKAGYVAIGLDHFAKADDPLTHAMYAGTLRRNFQGYTSDTADALLGVGVSSISCLPQGYVQNTANSIDYAKAIAAGVLPVSRGVALSPEDRERRDIIMSLMCSLKAPIPKGRYMPELQRLDPYAQKGDITYDGRTLTIAPHAQNHRRLIACVFDSYLSAANHRYSQAV